MEALGALVRTTGLEPISTTPASHNLLAVVQGISSTAGMARRMANTDGHHPSSDGHHPASCVATGRWLTIAGND